MTDRQFVLALLDTMKKRVVGEWKIINGRPVTVPVSVVADFLAIIGEQVAAHTFTDEMLPNPYLDGEPEDFMTREEMQKAGLI